MEGSKEGRREGRKEGRKEGNNLSLFDSALHDSDADTP
jgi:hypothetical protein